MPDTFTIAKRSYVMSRIRGRGNKETEVVLSYFLRKKKITGWRRHYQVFGKPDFAFPKIKLAIFVDGCFWHSCPKHCNMPVNNRPFWKKKLLANKARDLKVNRFLRKKGWRVMRIWEHDLAKRGEMCIRKIQIALSFAPSGEGTKIK